MSKKRLYEIAKEVGVESKVIVAKAQELGLSVKSHSSSVEEADANRITSSLKAGTAKDESKLAPKATPTPKEEKVEPKVDKASVTKSAPAKETSKAEVKESSVALKKPKSRNFKAEREARAKAEAERRKNGGGRDNRNRNQQGNDQGKRHNNDRRNQKGNGQGDHNKGNRDNSTNHDRNFQGKLRNDQNQNNRRDNARNNQAGPRIDLKARAAALKAEQNAEYSRQSETRFREEKAAEQRRAKEQEKARKEKQQAEVAVQKAAAETKPAPKPAPVAPKSAPTAQVQDTRIKREPAEIVKKLFMMGVMATQNQSLDGDTIELLMVDYGIEATKKEEVDNADIERFFVDEDYLNKDAMVERAPVVTIMGHVDHGKTTLLDTLRNSRVATGEAGGITQHIGAYQIEEGGKKITFLDTPGHAAFTSMRARGASVTDITILIVAADDGVMPQTIEAINHSKAAGVPIIVAINKIDKPGANPERVIGELAEHGVISTAWGGDSEFVEISAKFGQNIEELLETVLLVAEVEELKADPTVRAIGTVIEARLDKGKGAVATLLVQQGTLNVQDPIVVGNTFGRVRAMTNDLGRRIKTAAPSTPVSITGLNEAPMAGDHFAVYEDEKAARAAGEERAKRALMKQRQQTHRVSLDNLFDTLKAGEMKTVNVIIKADVQGSVEALAASLLKIDVEGVRVNVVHSAVGAINESDITLAEASDAVVIGFNVRPTPQARQQAETDEVEIRLHSIIYKVIEEIEDAMKGMLDPEFELKRVV